jgi:hypothetical protein
MDTQDTPRCTIWIGRRREPLLGRRACPFRSERPGATPWARRLDNLFRSASPAQHPFEATHTVTMSLPVLVGLAILLAARAFRPFSYIRRRNLVLGRPFLVLLFGLRRAALPDLAAFFGYLFFVRQMQQLSPWILVPVLVLITTRAFISLEPAYHLTKRTLWFAELRGPLRMRLEHRTG